MERYKIISSGSQTEWLRGCPIKIDKYNILFDTIENINILQAKYQNISKKAVKSMWIAIDGWDDAMDKTITLNNIAYLNVNVEIRGYFGANIPVKLNSASTSNVKISIEKVVFDDDSVWRNNNIEASVSLPVISAAEKFGDLYEQYCIEAEKLSLSNTNAFIDDVDFWVCPCGQGNEKSDERCCSCNTSRDTLLKISDINYLADEKEKRLEAAAYEEWQKQEKEKADIAAAKRQKSIIIKMCICLTVIVVLGIVSVYIQKYIKYHTAEKDVANGDFDAAIEKYTELDDFLNSKEKLLDTKQLSKDAYYTKAEQLALSDNVEDWEEAERIFDILKDLSPDDYSRCSKKIVEIQHNINEYYKNENIAKLIVGKYEYREASSSYNTVDTYIVSEGGLPNTLNIKRELNVSNGSSSKYEEKDISLNIPLDEEALGNVDFDKITFYDGYLKNLYGKKFMKITD